MIEYESANAQLLAMQKRKVEFEKLYSQYAPLGAKLKRIERKITVTEKEYLEILHHLGLAKLKLQNQEMLANMKIIDEPQFPINSIPNKRKLFVIVVVLFSFIFLVLGIIVFELLDKTIKIPKNLNKLSGLKTRGTFTHSVKYSNTEIYKINRMGIKPLIERIFNLQLKLNNKEIPVIQFLSHFPKEGKSKVIQLLYIFIYILAP